jgi:hypothetical protein
MFCLKLKNAIITRMKKSRIFILSLILIAISSNFILAQDTSASAPSPRNIAFLELGGSGGLYSINYERVLISKNKFSLNGRIGLAENFFGLSYEEFFVPLAVVTILGKRKLKWELGGGSVLFFNLHTYTLQEQKDGNFVDPFAVLGNIIAGGRLSLKRNWLTRISFTPFYNFHKHRIYPWAGASIGRAF